MRCFVLFPLALSLAGCSLAGLDRADLPFCVSNQDCAALAATVDDPTCETYVCVVETGRCAPAGIDVDGDGDPPLACGGADCDDTDPTRYGAATEICNGIDDDCNGLLDGPDEDDDGDLASDLCSGPAITSDCDDSDPFTFFDAPELCDGLDNDCLIDGVGRQAGGARPEPSEDRDGDQHAAIDATCMEGPVDDRRFFPLDDCDDERADVYPGAIELCDGIDNDCDGIPDNGPGLTEPGTACRPHGLLAGGFNTCVWTGQPEPSKRELVCWGQSSGGRLGVVLPPVRLDGPPPEGTPSGEALVVAAAAGLTSVSVGVPGMCGLRPDGQVVCWGTVSLVNGGVFLGGDAAQAPGVIPGVSDAVQVSVGRTHACALTSERTIICWGESWSSFVDGVTVNRDFSVPPLAVAGVSDVEEVGAGGGMTCARLASGAVWCWGWNLEGRLASGVGAPPEYDSPPRPVVGIDDATRLYVGDSNACALRASGELWCWGDNPGCAGDGCAPAISVAERVPLTGTVADVTLGGRHGCVLYDDGTFGCWGSNEFGQLALNAMDPQAQSAPTPSPTTGVLEVRAGERHTCVRLEDGVRCWGAHNQFALGDGRDVDVGPPFSALESVPASVIANAMQIEGGPSGTCFRLPNLSVVCTGTEASDSGELGGGGRSGQVPSVAFGPDPVRDIALGEERAMLVHQDGRVSTYGDNTVAATGDTDAVVDAVDASCGDDHCCLVRATGEAACMGMATDEALGDGGEASGSCGVSAGQFRCARTLLPVIGVEGARSIAAGGGHTCVVQRGGLVGCWGRNARGETGTLPLGATPMVTPVRGLPADDPATQLALSARGSCALLESGAVWCWGEGFGPGASSFSVDPLPLPGAINVAQIAAMETGLCVRYRSGAVRCVGDNDVGQLGVGLESNEMFPPMYSLPPGSDELVAVVGLTDARDIGCGPRHCCATRRSGQTVCWGNNSNPVGALGTGDDRNRPVPTPVASMLWSL